MRNLNSFTKIMASATAVGAVSSAMAQGAGTTGSFNFATTLLAIGIFIWIFRRIFGGD